MEGKPHHPYRTTLILASVPVQAVLMFTTAALAVTAFVQHSQAASVSVPTPPVNVVFSPNPVQQPTMCYVVQSGSAPDEAPSFTITTLPVSSSGVAFVKLCPPASPGG